MARTVGIAPGHGEGGRHPTRAALDAILEGSEDPGMFGRMFPMLPPLEVSDGDLDTLAAAMLDANPGSESGDNPNIPAGFTYLGQFIDHDITLDLTSIGEKLEDPLGVENFRTPSLDLDSIYGRGPDGSPHLYARTNGQGGPSAKLLIGRTQLTEGDGLPGDLPNDLPRSQEGQALIGDHRNDENLLVAQTHLAFLKFHNAVVDHLLARPLPPEQLFFEARQIVTWHYQWLVLHDFVERLTETGIVARILHEGRRFYRFKRIPFMPVEFSAAAYRMGHSMVRQVYSHNRIFTPGGTGPAASLGLLFAFTGLSGQILGVGGRGKPPPLPVETLPSNWIIDWRRFYDFGVRAQGVPINHSRKLDPFLVSELHTLPGNGGSLPARNLKRGVRLGLPSGQDVATHMGVPKPLTPDEIATGPDGAAAKAAGLHVKTPLWYYILKEAEQRGKGERMGPVGARIVAEVFVGLVHGDHDSYLWKRGKNWKPSLPSAVPETFTMTDLLQFVGDISPIDSIASL